MFADSRVLNFEIFGQKWGENQELGTPGGFVTFSFATENFPSQFSNFDSFIIDPIFQTEIVESFAVWENICDIKFSLVQDSIDVDIRLGWTNIDGPSGVLARATIPSSGPLESTLIELDPEENWFVLGEAEPPSIDFSATVIHEIGHTIGVDHSSDTSALMHPFYSGDLEIQQDDISAARAIYGGRDIIKSNVYRFYNENSGGHFFTADTVESEFILNTNLLQQEGIGFDAISSNDEDVFGSVPVYRFLNKDLGSHFYTAFGTELVHVLELDEFQYEGVGFRAYDQKTSATKPIYRFFDTVNGGHFFTIDENEKSAVEGLENFRYEGEAFFAYVHLDF